VQHLWIKNIILYLKRADGEPVVRPVKTWTESLTGSITNTF
jgi:hypothetical protein